jgi:hypothetical protein
MVKFHVVVLGEAVEGEDEVGEGGGLVPMEASLSVILSAGEDSPVEKLLAVYDCQQERGNKDLHSGC